MRRAKTYRYLPVKEASGEGGKCYIVASRDMSSTFFSSVSRKLASIVHLSQTPLVKRRLAIARNANRPSPVHLSFPRKSLFRKKKVSFFGKSTFLKDVRIRSVKGDLREREREPRRSPLIKRIGHVQLNGQ